MMKMLETLHFMRAYADPTFRVPYGVVLLTVWLDMGLP